MATIPKYSRQVGLPGEGPNVMVPIGDNTGIGDALQSVGRGIGEYAEAERSRLAVEKQQNDFIEATSMENDFLGGLIEREKEWSTRLGVNAEGITEEAIKHVEERAETYSRNASDPKAAELIRNRILDHGRSFVKRAESYSRQQRQVRFDTEQDATMGKYQEMAYGDFTRLESSITGVQKFYKEAVANKAMLPEQAELKSQEMAKKLTASALDGMIDRPEERELAVKWFKEGKFDGLGTLKNKYAEKVERLEKDIEEGKNHAKVEAEAENVKAWTAQQNQDEATLTDYFFGNEAKGLKPMSMKEFTVAMSRVLSHDVRDMPTVVQDNYNRQRIQWQSRKEARVKELERQAKGEGRKSDAATFEKIKMEIYKNPEMFDDNRIYANTAIDDKEKLTLLKFRDERKGKAIKPDIKEGHDYIDILRKNMSFIVPEDTENISVMEQLENQIIFANVVKTFNERVEQGEKANDVLEELTRPYLTKKAEKGFVAWLSRTFGRPSEQADKSTVSIGGRKLDVPTGPIQDKGKVTKPAGKTKTGKDYYVWSDGSKHYNPETGK